MINRYTDHSANERTYLAWIRTAIAVMAFGFLIEKFDLFVSYIEKATKDDRNFQVSLSAELAGMVLSLVGILIVISATLRFFSYKKAIESEQSFSYGEKKANLVLSLLVILLAVFLIAYFGHLFD